MSWLGAVIVLSTSRVRSISCVTALNRPILACRSRSFMAARNCPALIAPPSGVRTMWPPPSSGGTSPVMRIVASNSFRLRAPFAAAPICHTARPAPITGITFPFSARPKNPAIPCRPAAAPAPAAASPPAAATGAPAPGPRGAAGTIGPPRPTGTIAVVGAARPANDTGAAGPGGGGSAGNRIPIGSLRGESCAAINTVCLIPASRDARLSSAPAVKVTSGPAVDITRLDGIRRRDSNASGGTPASSAASSAASTTRRASCLPIFGTSIA